MSVTYIPEPNERPYYQGLFQAADTTGSGTLSGSEAVQFFSRSKLPLEVLKNIWTVADQPSTSSLDLKKFAVAVRLIQLTQNGQKGQGPSLAVASGVNLRPVFFEGVSGVSVPLPPAPGQPQQAPSPPQQQQPPPQQQPPQQQLQAPPTPTRSQPQPPPSPSPSTQGMPAMTPGGSRALVTQDPYTMTPTERARFEELFPTYAKPDGYIYGKEAVELFSKSGVDQSILRDIWSMVDRPVDNRLDSLEFAIAMHLIVCISKKNLPPPKGSLPNSLKALKAANSAPSPGPGASPQQQNQQQPPQQQYQPAPTEYPSAAGPTSMGSPRPPMHPPAAASFDHGPPPIVQTGGMSISDAFEGLSVTSNDLQAPSIQPPPLNLPSYVPENRPMERFSMEHDDDDDDDDEPTPAYSAPPQPQPPAPARNRAPAGPPPSSKALAANYDMGDSHQELDKLKTVLQKLQAENISLKAQLGSMSEEEKDVQKELSAVVTEIGKLSNELQSLRSQVLTAKTGLLEASAALKAAHERKGVLNDLIGEANDTKVAIEEATAAMKNASETTHHMERKKEEAVRLSENFESNLFGFDSAPAPAQAPAHSLSWDKPEPQTNSIGNSYNQAPAPQPAPMVQTVSSDDDDVKGGHTNQIKSAPESFSNEYNAPAPVPEPTQYAAQNQNSAPPTPQYHRPPVSYSQPPSAQPTPTLERPGVIGMYHSKQASLGFNPDFIMGGSAEPLPETTESGLSPAARAASSSSDFGYDDEDTFKKVEELKRKAERAAAAARDAEAAHNRLLSEAEELRADADKQDATARSLKAAGAEKKKGRFGRGGGDKKKVMRDAERAAQDAQDIRKRFLVVQGQAKDANALAVQTRREADKLREEAEKAELDMVAAASMREQQKKEMKDRQMSAPPAKTNGSGMPPPGAPYGYGQPPSGYGQPPHGYGQPPAAPQYGQMPPSYMGDNGFSAGVMGGGAENRFDLPSPNQLGPVAGGGYTDPFAM